MKISIGLRKVVLARALEDLIRRELGERLRKFAAAIAAVSVDLSDRNGRRGGGDKRCRIRVNFVEGGRIVQDDVHASLQTACRRAIDRLEHAVQRQMRSQPA